MASLKRVNNNKYIIRWNDYQRGKRTSITFHGFKNDAEKERLKFEKMEISMKAGFKPERLFLECTIAQLDEWFFKIGLKWKNGQREEPIKPLTINKYHDSLANFSECFGSNCQVNHLNTLAYRYHFPERKLSGLNVDIRAMLSIINFAVNHPTGPIDKKPMDLWKYKTKQKPIPYLELDQVNHILSTPMDSETRDMFLIYLHTGCRLDGLLSLTWENVNFQEQTITVIEKGSKERTIYITDVVSDILMKWSGRPSPMNYTNTKVAHRFKQLAEDSEIYFTSRWLRATCGSFMLSSGCSVEQVAEHLGHASIETTRRWYAKIIKAQQEKAINKFSTFVADFITDPVNSVISVQN